jgi:hypothetical protein
MMTEIQQACEQLTTLGVNKGSHILVLACSPNCQLTGQGPMTFSA